MPRFKDHRTGARGDHLRFPLNALSWGVARVLYGLTELDRVDLEVYGP